MITTIIVAVAITVALIGAGYLYLQEYAKEKELEEKKKLNKKRWETVFERTDLRKGAA